MLKKFGFGSKVGALMAGTYLLVAGNAGFADVNTDLPSIKIGTAGLVSPDTPFYGSSDTHTDGLVGASEVEPEIKALARALRHDPDLIYAYVKNKIEITPLFGLQKGSLGAYIDGHGTAFDQVQLMYDLLEESVGQGTGVSAPKMVIGTITLSGAQFDNWFGITNLQAAKNLLSYGGIPAEVSGSGTVTSVRMMHAWIKVQIDTMEYIFDPAFKAHENYAPLDNLESLMGFNLDTLRTAAGGRVEQTDATTQVKYVENLSPTGIATQMEGYAGSLLTALQSDAYKDKTLPEIIGGSVILTEEVPAGGWRNQSISDYTLTEVTAFSALTKIPDQFRTTLRVAFDNLANDANGNDVSDPVNKMLYVDEIYGRKLEIVPDMEQCDFRGAGFVAECNFHAALTVDGTVVIDTHGDTKADTTTATNRTGWALDLEVNHPYAANAGSYMDQLSTIPVDVVTTANIVHGWGHTSGELMEKWAREYGRDSDLPYMKTSVDACGGDGTQCEPSLPTSVQENTKAKVGASWLAQFNRMGDMSARLRGGRMLHHHTVGVSYSETDVGDANGKTTNEMVFWPGDQVLRLDLSTALSTVADTRSKEDALAQVIAASASALEGAVFEQMIDSVDTASTAERFDWAERNLGSTNYDPESQTTYQDTAKYLHLLPSNVGSVDTLILQEGHERGSASRPQYIAAYGTGGATGQLKKYLNQDYELYAINDDFVGPGYHLGESYTQQISDSDQVGWQNGPTRQRGAAFIAIKRDASGYVTDIAHVVTSRDGSYKGGGGNNGNDNENQFDPAKAADILKDEFEDKSVVHGVDLASGNVSWSSGTILSVGNGGFPYELALELKVVNNQETPRTHEPQHWRYTNMDDSLRAEAAISGSGMEAMGVSHPWNAAGSIAAFYTATRMAEGGTLSDIVALPFINKWWKDQTRYNVVTLTGSAGGTQFIRLPDGNFNAPAGSAATLTQTGERYADRPAIPGSNPGRSAYRRWVYSDVNFTATLNDGTTMTFSPQAHLSSNGGFHRAELSHKHMLTRWTSPNGFNVNYTYDQGVSATGVRLTSVTNDFGKTLTFNYSGSSAVPTSITNGQHTVTIAGSGFTVPDGGTYSFTAATNLPSDVRPRPGFQLGQVIVPEVGTALRYTYDEERRISQVEDAIAINDATDGFQQGDRRAYEFFIAPGFRGERVDPAGNNYTAWYGMTDNASHTLTGYQTLASDGTLGTAANETIDVKGYGLFVDEMNREVRTDFDAWGRVIARTYPDDRRQVFTYDDHSNVLSLWKYPSTGTDTLKVFAAYDTTINKPVQVMDARGKVTTLTYDAAGRGNVIQAQRPALIENGPRPTFHYGYNDDGQLTRVIDAECMVTTNNYFGAADGSNRGYLRQTIVDDVLAEAVSTCTVKAVVKAITTTFGYDAVGNQNSVTDPRNNATTTVYDPMRRPDIVTDALGNYTDTDYDLLGRTEEVRQFAAGGAFLMGSHKDYTLTSQVATEFGPRCFTSNGTFDQNRAACTSTAYTYTDLDQVDEVTDAESRVTKTEYQADGQVTELYQAWGSADEILYQQFFYDTATGRKVGVEDANGNRTTYTYDTHSRLMQTIFPVSDITTVDEHGQTQQGTSATGVDFEEYSYDANGNMVEKRTRAGDFIVNAYDTLNRLESKQVYHGSKAGANLENTVSYSYDQMGRDVCISQTGGTTADGHAIPAHALYFVYDTAGRLDYERQGATGCTDAGGFKINVGYDKAGNRTSLMLPGGGTNGVTGKLTNFTYDALNRMDKVKNGANTETYADYSYDALSRRTGLAFQNGQAVTVNYFSHNPDGYVDGAPKSLAHAFTAGQDITYGFGYNRVNQITSRSLSNPAYMFRSFEDNPVETYEVNGLNQYVEVGKSIGGAAPEVKAPLYTDNGSLDTYGAWDYDYDAENRLVHAKKTVESTVVVEADYGYDPKGRRIVKAVKEGTANAVYSHFLYEGDEPIADLMGASATASLNPMVSHYVHGANVDERLVVWSYDQELDNTVTAQFFYHADHQGSIVALSNGLAGYTDSNGDTVALGAQVSLYNYDAYGNLKAGAGDDQPFLYTGRRYDAETGLYYYRARYYSAELGRFLQTDPIGYEDNMNMYGYTNNDPVNGTDPMGEKTVKSTQTVWVGAVYARKWSSSQTIQYSDVTGQPIAMAISTTVGNGIGLGAGASEDVSVCEECNILDTSGGNSLSFQADFGIGVDLTLVEPTDENVPGDLSSKKVERGAGLGPGAGFSITLDKTEIDTLLIYDPNTEQWVDVTDKIEVPEDKEK